MRKIQLTLLLSLTILWSNATVIMVTNKNDSGPGSLRNANDIAAPFDTIRFSPSLVSAGNDTIKLQSQITINNKLVFIGLRSPNKTLYISGQNAVRIFTVIGTGSTFDSLALINGRASVGGAIYAVSTGAMIHVKNCVLRNNTATQRGGAIHFYNGDLQIINSDVSNNTATTEGGAVYYQIGQSLLITESSFTFNTCVGRGGAISMVGGNTSTFDIIKSTLSSNSSNTDGAAIFYEGRNFTMDSSNVKLNSAGGTIKGIIHFELRTSIVNVSSSFSNSTIAQNTGTGIASFITLNLSTSVNSSVDVSYCTINNNSQGGIFSEATTDDDNAVSTVTVTHSTIANNGNLSTGYGGVYSNAYVLTGSWNVSSSVTVTNSTIVYNQSQNPGSGILSKGRLAAFSYLGVKSSIVAQNSGVNLISFSPTSPITSLGYNIFSDASVVGSSGNDQLGVSAASMNLRALGNYGGPTATMMPNASSVAVNLGTPTDVSAAQNGSVNGGRRDVGAAEYVFCATTPTTITASACSNYTLNGQTYTSSGVFTQTLINSAGCDSVVTLNLTITPNDNSQFTWAGRIGSPDTDNGVSVTTDKQGNVYSIGNFEGLIDLDPGAAAANFNSGTVPAFYISKLDADGNYVWGGIVKSNVTVYAYGIKVDTAGNMYITGKFYGNCDFNPGGGVFNLLSGAPEIFVLKLSTTGAFVWAKAMPYVSGNFSSNESNAIAIDNAGNIYTTGGYGATTDFDPNAGTFNLTSSGYQDIFVSKLDASGNFVWAKSMGNPTSGDVGNDITVDAAGNVYVTGHFQGTADFDPSAAVSNLTSAGSLDVYVVKLNSSGNLVWARALGGTNVDVAWGIQCDAAGNVYTTGNFQGTADFNPGAGSNTLTSAGVNDIFISKLDASGNYLWSRRMGSTLADFSTEIKLDAAGNIYTTGSFQGTVDFNPDAGVNNLTSTGGADIFLSKLDTDGEYVWAKKLGGTGDDIAYGLAIGFTGSLYVNGSFSNTVDFDPNAGTFNLTSSAGIDVFIMKLGECCVPTTSTINRNVCSSYTSPSGQFTWTSSGVYSDIISNSVGCDSIITINLTIRQKTTGTINLSICQGQSFFFNGANRTVQGPYLDTLVNAAGCDSIVTLNLTVNPLPTASISPATVTICNGSSASLTASGGTSYAWSNSLGSGATVSVSPTLNTTYNVTVTNANNCSATASKLVTVNPLPNAGISPATVTICNGASASLTASGGTSYAWSNSLGSGATVSVSPTLNTTYTVTVTDANNCSATESRLVTVNALPTAGISPSVVTICSGASTSLIASGGTSYAWSNSLGSGATVSVSPTLNTTYTVTVTDANNCSATASKFVTVNPLPTASISPSVVTICSGASTSLTASGGTSYAWSNSLGSGATVSVSPTLNTTYTVTVTDANNCSATASKLVTVNALPNAGISPSVITICNGASASLTTSGGTSYAWSNSLGSGATVSVSPALNTTYTVTVTDANNCSATASKLVTVNPLPNAAINGPTTICSGLSATLTASGGTGYSWDNSLGSNAQVTATPLTTTTYNVTVTDANSCSAVTSQTVSVTNTPTATIAGISQICNGESTTLTANGGNTYLWANGLGANASITVSPIITTTYTVTATIGANCSATATQTVIVNQPSSSQFSQTICSGSSYFFNGILRTISGSYLDTLQTSTGCDSLVTLNLTVNNPLTGSFNQAICSGSSYVFNGVTLTQDGAYNDTILNGNGCDSIVTLNLSISAVLQSSFSDSICSGDSYLFGGNSISQEGQYFDTLQTSGGCDSIVTLNLTLNSLPQPIVTQTDDTLSTQTFVSYKWFLNGAPVIGGTSQKLLPSQTGDYSVVVTDAFGCSDTSDILNVTIIVDVKDVLSNFGVKLYPNPNTGTFILEFADEAVRTIEVTDALGKVVIASFTAKKQNKIALNETSTGVYFIYVNQNGKIKNLKFSLIK